MTLIRTFEIPDDRHYWVEKHLWVLPATEGAYRVGLTVVAYHLLRHSLEAISVKRSTLQGEVPRGKSVAMVESLKYIGGVPAPFTGFVVRPNDRLATDPGIAEQDPYGEGWIVEMRPSDPATALAPLLTGEEAIAAYRKLVESQNIS